MTRAAVSITDTNSIIDQIMQRQEMVARRAFELFQSHADEFSAELDYWFRAEQELFPQPDVRFRQADGRFEIDAALPGADPKKVDVKVTPEDVLITAEQATPKSETVTAVEAGSSSDGRVRYFRTIHLPEPIVPDGVKASYKQGILHVTAPIVKPQGRTVEVRT